MRASLQQIQRRIALHLSCLLFQGLIPLLVSLFRRRGCHLLNFPRLDYIWELGPWFRRFPKRVPGIRQIPLPGVEHLLQLPGLPSAHGILPRLPRHPANLARGPQLRLAKIKLHESVNSRPQLRSRHWHALRSGPAHKHQTQPNIHNFRNTDNGVSTRRE